MPLSLIPASTACDDPVPAGPALVDTYAHIIREQIPNLCRLYLNVSVVQTCFCLDRYVRMTWHRHASSALPFQSFLANGFAEALSGAIKLARFRNNRDGRPARGLVIDSAEKLGPFASIDFAEEGRLEFIPGLTVTRGVGSGLESIRRSGERFGFAIILPEFAMMQQSDVDAIDALIGEQAPIVIACVNRTSLATCWSNASASLHAWQPDIVVFDESFVNHDVPWAAFTASQTLFDSWNRESKGTFHSTTYQPNTISNLHFIRCLKHVDPEFHARIADDLERIHKDPVFCLSMLRRLYSPFLAKTIAALGFDRRNVTASGHYIAANMQKIFDGVAGVACSIRGHNPGSYIDDIDNMPDGEVAQALAERLERMSGLNHVLPAVSGASAVENALRIGLVAQFPRRFVLAFQGGFGGKTLLALTGTAKASYKAHLDPLYEHVLYLDPFAADILEQLEDTLSRYPVAIVQMELIQAVGGARALPEHVIRYLHDNKHRWRYLLFVDEVQTGMYRSGPFLLSKKLGIAPDLLTIGKGTSDMMVPCALTLYSEAVHERAMRRSETVIPFLQRQHASEIGHKTILNTLERIEVLGLAEKAADRGALFGRILAERLHQCPAVRGVRAHGLLIGIELETRHGTRRWLKKRLASLYLLGMLHHPTFPVLVGFCQYEPHVLKLTPPLSITAQEVVQVCDTIVSVLKRPLWRLLLRLAGTLIRAKLRARRPRRRGADPVSFE